MNRSQPPASQHASKTDPHGDTLPRDRDERYDGGEDYDARGGQFFGTPGDYGRRQGWLDGHLVGRERAMGAPQTGYNDALHGHRRAGIYGGTGRFAWTPEPQDGSDRDPGFDPEYQQWRHAQMRALDDDYRAFRDERYKKFSDEFSAWRTARALTKGPTSKPDTDEAPHDGGARRDK